MSDCACIALSVERKISDIVDVVNFDKHPEVIEHKSMSNPHWNGTHFRVPQTGLYHVSWGFYRDGTNSLSDDDISLHLMKSPLGIPSPPDQLIATAFAGEDHANGNGRKSGHHVVIVTLQKNEDLYSIFGTPPILIQKLFD